MEVIAAASSFAGILGLAGQCVGGLENLKNLFENIAGASKTVDGFLRDINSLLRTLHDVEVLLNTVSKKSSADEADADVASLQIHLEDCSRDVSSWLKTARDLRPSPGRGTKSWARKFWVAVNNQSVSGIRQEINCRRTEINTSLLLLSATLGVHAVRKADRTETKIEQGNTVSTELLSNSNAAMDEVLQRLENLNNTAKIILSHSEGSMRSLQSAPSSISRMSSHSDLSRIAEEPPPPYRSISRGNSSYFAKDSSRPSTAQSTRRTMSGGSQTSLSIFSLSSMAGSGRLKHGTGIKRLETVIRSSTLPELYTCAFCTEQFAEEDEAKQHQSSNHRRTYSWSCSALRSIQDAFFQRQDGLICGYCDTQVAFSKHPEAALLCRRHLRLAHRFQQCQDEKRFFKVNHFRQHLKQSHGALLGEWNNVLENACLEAVPVSQQDRLEALGPSIEVAATQMEVSWHRLSRTNSEYRFPKRFGNATLNAVSSSHCDHPQYSQYISRMRLAGLLKQEIDFVDHLLATMLPHDELVADSITQVELVHQREDLKMMREDVLYSAEYHREAIAALGGTEKKICDAWSSFLQDRSPEDEPKPTLATDGIKAQSYDASLLGNWNGTRDRVNRWMLHSLGSSEEQTEIHRSMLHDPEMPVSHWGRLVLKYWFMDEAALGVELEPSQSVGAADSPHASSLWSSEFESCRSHHSDALSQRSNRVTHLGDVGSTADDLLSENGYYEH